MSYIGRFAPTPSGPLHLGSLFTALASYLDAKHHHGIWLVRIEDLDQPRCIPGASAHILRTLERFGLLWDGPVLYQSARTALYHEHLKAFQEKGNYLYLCSCTRRQRQAQGGGPYPGSCRQHALGNKTYPESTHKNPIDSLAATSSAATRWWMPENRINFSDRIMGEQHMCPAALTGDPVLRRRDRLFAYHWAVVIDDELQSVSHVVRGMDLLDQTSIHLALQAAGDIPHPSYAHVPLILGENGQKLSKSERAASLQINQPGVLLTKMLVKLGQLSEKEASERSQNTATEILTDAITRWDIRLIPKTSSLTAQNLIA